MSRGPYDYPSREAEILQLHGEGRYVTEIAESLHIGAPRVLATLERHGLEKNCVPRRFNDGVNVYCKGCDSGVPIARFTKNKQSTDGLERRCRACQPKRTRKPRPRKVKVPFEVAPAPDWVPAKARPSAPTERWVKMLKSKYGITPEDFWGLLKNQDFRCAICERDTPDDPRGFNWHVDHNHSTGEVRGLLCGCCNRGLGQFKDDIAFLGRAIEYLVDNDSATSRSAAA